MAKNQAKELVGIVKGNPRVYPKVIYLTVTESANPNAADKQWVFFRKEHTMQTILSIENAVSGSSIICMGMDNFNQTQSTWQIVVKELKNIIPPNAAITQSDAKSFSTPTPVQSTDMSMLEKQLQVLLAGLPKDEAIAALSKQIAKLAGGN